MKARFLRGTLRLLSAAHLYLFIYSQCWDSTCTARDECLNLNFNPFYIIQLQNLERSTQWSCVTHTTNVFTAKSLKSLHKITFLFYMSWNVSHLTEHSAYTCQERATQFGEVVCLAPQSAFCEFTCRKPSSSGCSLHVHSQNCWTTFLLFVFTRANCLRELKHTNDETLTAFYSPSFARDRNGNSQTQKGKWKRTEGEKKY